MSDASKIYLFVYGTLKRGHCRAHYLSEMVFLGDATTTADYRLYDCGTYPGLVESAQGIGIEGELWKVTEECMVVLDEVEGVDIGLYERGNVSLAKGVESQEVAASHAIRNATTYFYQQDVSDLIDVGTRWD